MSCLKLSEFQAKKLFYKKNYFCEHLPYVPGNNFDFDFNNYDKKYVVKVDVGIKHRMKHGLVKVNLDKNEVKEWIISRNVKCN